MKSLFVMSVLFFGLNANAYKACSSAQWGEANDACESKCSGLGHGTCHYATSCGIGIFGGGHADCSCGGMLLMVVQHKQTQMLLKKIFQCQISPIQICIA
jgi:hypothetical protein